MASKPRAVTCKKHNCYKTSFSQNVQYLYPNLMNTNIDKRTNDLGHHLIYRVLSQLNQLSSHISHYFSSFVSFLPNSLLLALQHA